MSKRDDSAYEIEALSKGLAVLEALESDGFEPVSQKRIERRTGFSRDFVMRALKTFKIRGYAVQDPMTGDWRLGPNVLRLSSDFHKVCMSALEKTERVRAIGNSDG